MQAAIQAMLAVTDNLENDPAVMPFGMLKVFVDYEGFFKHEAPDIPTLQ
jgi:hypothetical protein